MRLHRHAATTVPRSGLRQPRMGGRRAGLAALTVVAATAVAAPTAGAAVATAETWPRPVSGSFELAGHGYGHGRGMSQWGAYGAATRGLDHRAILDFYYPGTQHVVQAAAPVRVWVKSDNDSETRVEVVAGLTASTGSVSRTLPTTDAGGTIRGWRVQRDAGGFYLQYLDAATSWRAYDVTGTGRSASPVTFTATGGLVRLVLPDGTRREYRGGVRAVASGASPGLRSVAVLPMEDYLRSVVPAEMPPSWPVEALRAQSVAARTYASYERHRSSSAAYDTCDDPACQVFRGTAAYRADGSLVARYEYAATDQAVTATANQVRHYGGTPALTQFGAANGGWTVSGGLPYLPAQADPYDGVVASTAHRWSATVSAATLQQRWPAVGSVTALRVVERDGNGRWGGRSTSVVVTGTSGSVTLTGEQFRSALGLRSPWWVPVNTARRVTDWQGDGRADLLSRDPGGGLWMFAGTGGGRFATRVQIGVGWEVMSAVHRAGDFDGDGDGDLLARRDDGSLWLYPGNGTGGFRAARQVGTGWQGMVAVVGAGSWDGDGRADVLAVDGGGRLLLYPGNGTGGWLAPRQVGSGWSGMDAPVAVGDWDGDGRGDLLARDAAGALWAYPGDGSGGFLARRQVGRGWEVMDRLIGGGDVDGDGRPDVLATDATGALWLYPGNGTGGWLPRAQVGSGWTGMELLP